MRDWLWDFWYWTMRWWYSEGRRGWHPDAFRPQPLWCAVVSFILGPKQRGGTSWTEYGTDHWWCCDRCGSGDSSL